MTTTPERSGADVCVIIPAAGSGTRLGEPVPKAFVDLGGRTIIERCVDNIPAELGASVEVPERCDLPPLWYPSHRTQPRHHSRFQGAEEAESQEDDR